MSSVPAADGERKAVAGDERISAIESRLNFVRMRRRGFCPDDILQTAVMQERETLAARTNEIAAQLIQRQVQVEATVNALIEEAKAIDSLDAARSQNENLKETLETLKKTQAEFTKVIQKGQQELDSKKIQKQALQNGLAALTQKLNKPPSHVPPKATCIGGKLASAYTASAVKNDD